MNPAVPMTFETKKIYIGEIMTLEEKISFCFENLSYSADSCKVIHESSQCILVGEGARVWKVLFFETFL